MEETRVCKYCNTSLELCIAEGLTCEQCSQSVHIECLHRGVPGGLNGDTFFTFTCQECSDTGQEIYIRDGLSWLHAVVLVFYHLQTKTPGLARRGYFHWRYHVASFIEKHWNVLFTPESKKTKKPRGTIADILSHFSSVFFLSGTDIFKEEAWWTLMYPRLTPTAIIRLYALLAAEKQKGPKQEKVQLSELFKKVLADNISDKSLLDRFVLRDPVNSLETVESKETTVDQKGNSEETLTKPKSDFIFGETKHKSLLPTFESDKKCIKLSSAMNFGNDFMNLPCSDSKGFVSDCSTSSSSAANTENVNDIYHSYIDKDKDRPRRLLDPMCHYNTSIRSLARIKSMPLRSKLTGGVGHNSILSPYSNVYLKPYIMIDPVTFPPWLKLMAELQLYVNRKKNKNYVLPPRDTIDYMVVRPEHIPAVNSLCNQFFWPGIDLTEALQYPDFSCIAVYKRLIVGFAFLVPDVTHTENYLSFLFVRPMWRNCGIAKFMIYYLCQASLNKDIILHVAVNSPALFLYQKFGFKVERLEKNFYDKYITDPNAPKNAFMCRLERSHL